MKACWRGAALVAALLVLGPIAAVAGEGLRLGVVDLQRIIALSKRGEQARLAFKDAILGKQKEIKALQRELDALESDFEDKGASLPPEEREAYEARFRHRVRELRRRGEDVREELGKMERRLTNQLSNELVRLTRLYAEKHGFDLVLEATHTPKVYAVPTSDLTDTILQLYDAQPLAQPSKEKSDSP